MYIKRDLSSGGGGAGWGFKQHIYSDSSVSAVSYRPQQDPRCSTLQIPSSAFTTHTQKLYTRVGEVSALFRTVKLVL